MSEGGGINISGYTSPLKLFEYMSHKKAIIASDLPVLKEVLNNKNSVLVEHDNIKRIDKIELLKILLKDIIFLIKHYQISMNIHGKIEPRKSY